MSSETQEARQHREEAARRPEGDIVGILLMQHADITDAMERIKGASAADRATGWESLKAFLKAHETAEQEVVHPVSRRTSSEQQSEARVAEEREADEAIAALDRLGADGPEFETRFAEFADKVHEHAEHEEHEEFPTLDQLPEDERAQMGDDFLTAFRAVG